MIPHLVVIVYSAQLTNTKSSRPVQPCKLKFPFCRKATRYSWYADLSLACECSCSLFFVSIHESGHEMWLYSQANFSSLSLLCEAEKVFFIFIMLYIFPLNFLQAAERILKKAEQTHKQRVEVCLAIPLLKGIVIK